MKYLIFTVILSFVSTYQDTNPTSETGFVINDEKKEIEKTIHALFDAMRENDAEKAGALFAENAEMHTAFITAKGEKKIRSGTVKEFLHAVGMEKPQVWDERIRNLKINVDGHLAHAWMEYDFHIGDKRLHCGVNSIHLINLGEGWKLFQIIDTRRAKKCK